MKNVRFKGKGAVEVNGFRQPGKAKLSLINKLQRLLSKAHKLGMNTKKMAAELNINTEKKMLAADTKSLTGKVATLKDMIKDHKNV